MKNDKQDVLRASGEPKPMGDTLFEYARPLFSLIPQDNTFAELKAIFVFAGFVWNVGLLHEVSDAVAYLARKMPRRLRLRPPQGLALICRMLKRKEESFPGDNRAALDVDVVRDGWKFRVKAVGVDPEDLPEPPTDCDLCEMELARRERYLH
jgi:hypothetical protein